MKFKGTQKWVLSRKKGSYQYISGEDWKDFARVVVQMKGANYTSSLGEANLKLIIAAPNLLNACKNAIKELELINGSKEIAILELEKAIEKALK